MLTERLEFAPERDAEIFAAVPAAPAVFLLRGADAQAEPYVTKTANLRRRLLRLLGPAVKDGALPAGRNPSDVAALVMATLRGLYMLPPESRNPKRGEQALRELERSLGI